MAQESRSNVSNEKRVSGTETPVSTATHSDVVDSKEVAPPAQQQFTFPEGGREAWLTLFGAFLLQYASFGYSSAFGVYQDYYVRVYLTNYTPSQIGWIGGIQLFFHFSSGVFVGRIFDRGHFYKLAIAGTFFHALALFMLSITHVNSFYQVFLTHGLCLGLSNGLVYIPSLGIVGHHFQRKRALGMGVASAGSALGAVLHPIMLNHLLTTTSLGFRNTVRVSAGVNVALMIIAILICRTRLPPKPQQRFPVGEWLKEAPYAWCLAACFFIFLGLFYPLFYIQLLAHKKGLSRNLSFYIISILNAASVIGRTVPVAFSHRFGVLNMEFFACFMSGVIILFIPLIKDAAGAIVIAILYGLFSGTGIALFPSVVGCFTKDISELGTRVGLAFAIAGVLGLVAQPIAGGLLSRDYHWLNASLFAGITLMFGGLCAGVSRFYFVKSRPTSTFIV